MKVAVVGSGVAGTFAAHALVARGLSVEVLDVGEELDERRRDVVAKLREVPPDAWPAADYELIRANATVGTGELPKKLHFGSDYIYARDRSFASLSPETEARAPYPTFARGGFSNIWGAAVLPTAACDMADWPIKRAELEPYFCKVAALLPICGGAGTLSQAFPAYRDKLGALDPGPQGRLLLADLKKAEAALLLADTLYGESRLAVHVRDHMGGLACSGCGECFTGCVRNSIFSTLPILDDLVRRQKLGYSRGLFVDRIEESGGTAAIEAIDIRTGGRRHLSFDAIFVAAGPINTTRLFLRSRNLYDHPISLRESQKFVLPMLRWRAAKTAIEAPAPTLAAAFLETKVPSLSDHWIHVQVVAMNRLLLEGQRIPTGPFLTRLAAPALRRAMVAWCGMHSDHSSRLELCLEHDRTGGDTLRLRLRVFDDALAAAREAARSLAAKGHLFRTTFLPQMIKFSNPGSGTHCGASFPMRHQPQDQFDSDTLGRPFGWSRVFAVDSSVLPSIPGTTLAFSVMANAYRIASLAPIEASAKKLGG